MNMLNMRMHHLKKSFLIFHGNGAVSRLEAISVRDAVHQHLELHTVNTFVYSLRTPAEYREAIDIIAVIEENEFIKLRMKGNPFNAPVSG